ncbi:hypothetical protein EDEG_01525 [Edhazardia aedis USNM 41457]|uniref:Uncharacterized protein n=1 Tax=Edhazardia aedis (strain USNM 41457) TaxID=1003232 RepID=J8ZWZ3_EDHAE|nr:hypothetical protein EDEG_01525 [Edhazardia aedis USNM 41457]|eukprot:EJW04193.1 hypothetical protein EDEG_01525 [Edhazardia aedis USNM 41457]
MYNDTSISADKHKERKQNILEHIQRKALDAQKELQRKLSTIIEYTDSRKTNLINNFRNLRNVLKELVEELQLEIKSLSCNCEEKKQICIYSDELVFFLQNNYLQEKLIDLFKNDKPINDVTNKILREIFIKNMVDDDDIHQFETKTLFSVDLEHKKNDIIEKKNNRVKRANILEGYIDKQINYFKQKSLFARKAVLFFDKKAQIEKSAMRKRQILLRKNIEVEFQELTKYERSCYLKNVQVIIKEFK